MKAVLKPIFPAIPTSKPATSKIWCTNLVVVVFPLLPVIPGQAFCRRKTRLAEVSRWQESKFECYSLFSISVKVVSIGSDGVCLGKIFMPIGLLILFEEWIQQLCVPSPPCGQGSIRQSIPIAQNNNAAFNGVWNVFPYFESGKIIISDIDSGLFIIKKK